MHFVGNDPIDSYGAQSKHDIASFADIALFSMGSFLIVACGNSTLLLSEPENIHFTQQAPRHQLGIVT